MKYLFQFLILIFCFQSAFSQQLQLSQKLDIPSFSSSGYEEEQDEIAEVAGDQAIIASRNNNSAIIFEKNSAGKWFQSAILKGSGAVEESFRVKAAITYNKAITLSSENAYIFEKLNGNWVETTKIPLEEGPHSVAIFESFAMIGNPWANDRAGETLVYQKLQSGWVEVQRLINDDNQKWDEFGYHVVLQNNKAIIQTNIVSDASERQENDMPLYVFDYLDGQWRQIQKISGITCNFDGCSTPIIDIDNDNIIASTPDNFADVAGGYREGSVLVFSKQSEGWSKSAFIEASDKSFNDFFGSAIAISGNIITSTTRDKGSYIYHFEDKEWIESQVLRNYYILDYDKSSAIAFGADANSVYFLENKQNIQLPVIEGFSIVNADNNKVISPFKGGVLNLKYLNARNYNLIANTKNVGSMTFELRSTGDLLGEEYQFLRKKEQYPPFALFGDKKGVFRNWQPESKGYYTLIAIPYTGKDSKGIAGKPYTIKFRVIEEYVEKPKEDPFVKFNDYKSDSLAIILVDADKNTFIQFLREGDIINLQDHTNKNYNILALTPDREIRFELNLPNSFYAWRLEKHPPYAAFGDRKTGFRNWEPELGIYELSVEQNGSEKKTIHFEVVDKPVLATSFAKVNTPDMTIYPNPTTSEVKVNTYTETGYQLKIHDSYGKVIYHKKGFGKAEKTISLVNYKPGIYLVTLESNGTRSTQRLIVR